MSWFAYHSIVPPNHPAQSVDVAVVPGTPGPVEKWDDAAAFTQEFGFPVIIKAAFGGGGKGMRIVREQSEMKEAFERATSEAKSAFGDGTVFIESQWNLPSSDPLFRCLDGYFRRSKPNYVTDLTLTASRVLGPPEAH